MVKIAHLYSQIISIENLFQAWNEFRKGKRGKKDVQLFESCLEDNLFLLHQELESKTYRHRKYTAFNIYDPKFRNIHKATVRDRIVHHAICSIIEPIFDKTFIFDSYSCRKNKGMHRAVNRLSNFARKVSKNYTGKCFVLKLDIKKFFASVYHQILTNLIRKKINDEDLLWLIENILKSFSNGTGIPIGNLTSQIFANVYLNELDKFVKQDLRINHYIRYADDFVILSDNRNYLEELMPKIGVFLRTDLKLSIHPDKIIIRKFIQGMDFLGYMVLPHYKLIRTRTKRRIFKKLKEKIGSDNFEQSLQSYLGYLAHANTHKLQKEVLRHFPPQDNNERISPKFCLYLSQNSCIENL